MLSEAWTPRVLTFYAWHLFDGLMHLLLESTYVYGCFAYYTTKARLHVPGSLLSEDNQNYGHRHVQYHDLDAATQKKLCYPDAFPRHFLARPDRLYGNAYSSSVNAQIWQEVAKADSRYAGIDLTTLCLEIITVALAGPLAIYVAERVRKDVAAAAAARPPERKSRGRSEDGSLLLELSSESPLSCLSVETCFWSIILAVGELYGG